MNSNRQNPAPVRRWQWPLAFALGCVVADLPGQSGDGVSAPRRDVMGLIAKAFSDLEAALAGRDVEAAVSSAERLATVARPVVDWEPPADGENAALFRILAQALPRQAARVAAAARNDGLPAAGAAAEQLRQNCLACHVQFRSEDAERRPMPGYGNTIWGRVTLADKPGGSGRRTNDAVVFVDSVASPLPGRFEVARPRVSQLGKQFSPRVLPVVVGSIIDFPNDDTIFHNVFSLSKTRPFDLGVYEKGKSKRVRFDKTGLVRIYCNIHAKMSATILVLQNPCFAVTDDSGFYVITGVPDGKFVLRSWHALGSGEGREVELRKSATVRVDFTVVQSRRLTSHKNKFGKPYSSKY